MVKYKDIVKIKLSDAVLEVKIHAKLKEINAYVGKITDWESTNRLRNSNMFGETDRIFLEATRKFGHPVRQLDLDWGSFSGGREFIIKEEDIIDDGQ